MHRNLSCCDTYEWIWSRCRRVPSLTVASVYDVSAFQFSAIAHMQPSYQLRARNQRRGNSLEYVRENTKVNLISWCADDKVSFCFVAKRRGFHALIRNEKLFQPLQRRGNSPPAKAGTFFTIIYANECILPVSSVGALMKTLWGRKISGIMCNVWQEL